MKLACENCGANVKFDVIHQKCYCEHCNTFTEIEKFKLVTNEMMEYNECTCTSCGAKLIANETEIITNCVYCGSNEIIKGRLQGEYEPESILPFCIAKEDILQYYTKFVKGNNSLKELKDISVEDIKGIYVPYYAFSWKIKLFVNGKENFIIYTDYKDAGKQFDNLIMEVLHPFDVNSLKTFNPGYLAGFYADTLNENQDEIQKNSKNTVTENLKNPQVLNEQIEKIKNQNYYSDAKILSQEDYNNTFYVSFLSKSFILLPVYFFSVKHANKIYLFAMNGRTGRMACKRPETQSFKTLYVGQKVEFINQYSNVILDYAEEIERENREKDRNIEVMDFIIEREKQEIEAHPIIHFLKGTFKNNMEFRFFTYIIALIIYCIIYFMASKMKNGFFITVPLYVIGIFFIIWLFRMCMKK